MGKKKATLTARARCFLRLLLLWVRKGWAFGRRFLSDSEGRGNFLKGLCGGGATGAIQEGYQIWYREKEFSFSETPMCRRGSKRSGRSVRHILSSLPCTYSQPSADMDIQEEYRYTRSSRESFFIRSNSVIGDNHGCLKLGFASAEQVKGAEDADKEDEIALQEWMERGQETLKEEEKDVDAMAEEFIARFHKQMKLQRQVSLLQYHEMLQRGT